MKFEKIYFICVGIFSEIFSLTERVATTICRKTCFAPMGSLVVPCWAKVTTQIMARTRRNFMATRRRLQRKTGLSVDSMFSGRIRHNLLETISPNLLSLYQWHIRYYQPRQLPLPLFSTPQRCKTIRSQTKMSILLLTLSLDAIVYAKLYLH